MRRRIVFDALVHPARIAMKQLRHGAVLAEWCGDCTLAMFRDPVISGCWTSYGLAFERTCSRIDIASPDSPVLPGSAEIGRGFQLRSSGARLAIQGDAS